jgi:amino acid adenylation domain-containing protein
MISDTRDNLLSYTQESLWLFQQLADPDEPAYNETVAFEITGAIDSDALRRAVHATIMRHEALRTRFYETGDGPRAEIVEAVPDAMTVVDLRASEVGEVRVRAEELLAEHSHRPFDLRAVPLLRTLLVALPGDAWCFGLTAHHIVIDDWSIRLILAEVGECYQAIVGSGHPPQRTPPTTGFRDFVRETRTAFEGGRYADQVESWRRSLEHSPQLLGMVLDRPRPAQQTFRGSSRTRTVRRADVEPLLDVCRRECGSSAFPVFLAAYAVLLSRYTGQDAFAIGTTVLNRATEDDLALVGCCVNTLPLYVPVDQDATFRQLLRAAQEATDRLLDDGDAPYPKVLEAVGVERAVNYNPVFQTMLTLLGSQPALELGPDVGARYRHVRRTAAKFDLTLYISRSQDEYEFEVEFNTDLFDPGTAERVLGNYAQLLKTLATSLDVPVNQPSMLREDEERLILGVWNDTAAAYPAGTLVDMIEEQVRRSPDGIAVACEGQRLTYDMLNRRANQVGRSLRKALGTAAAVPFVGVYMERSVDLVVALLAIVKAGYAYVPIDPGYPAARVEFMVQDADLSLVLTQHRHRDPLDVMGVPALVLPDPAADAEDDRDISRELRPDSPVYMIYTSGSTGRPKGAINRHDSLFNRLYWMQSAFALSSDDKVLQKTPYGFDVSVWEFFWPLMVGATIVVAEPEGHRDPEYLKRAIRSHGVTTVHFVPSMLNAFLEADDLTQYCGSLRRVVCSGEALSRKTIEVFFATLSCELHNLYGPTEAAIDVSHWPCTLDYPGEIVPIGTPIANVRLYVMDPHQMLQPVGVPGELCIGGVAVASGYHRRDQLSSKVFIEDPYGTQPGARLYRTGDLARFLPDGQIQYLGRLDNQAKLRGLRIEPDEVAAVLRELPGVKDAAVVVHTSGSTQALAAYVVAADPDPDEIRAGARRLLPEFLVPQFIVDVPALPTTPNGKLDRSALPDPADVAPVRDRIPLTTAVEHQVGRVWRAVLDIETVSADSRFFALGGDSILALRVAARLREAGYAVQVRDVYAHPTLADLAASLERDPDRADAAVVPAFALVDTADRALLPRDAEDAWPLTKLQAGMIYHSLLDEQSPVYHDIFDYEISGAAGPDTVRQAVQATVARHGQLRSFFDLERYGEPLQIVLPATGVPVAVVDVTHLESAEQDKVIDEWREHEKRRPIDLDGPLVRFSVHIRANGRMNLGISFHHLILDGWSVALVVEEIRHRCAQLVTGRAASPPATTPSYGTYVTLERASARRGADQHAWQKLLAGFPATLLAGPPPVGGAAEPATVERIVPPDLDDRLRRRAASLGVPLKSLYLSAHCAALAGRTSAARVITGLVTDGRPEIPGGSEMVGLFLNTVPFPAEITDTRGADLIASVFEREQALIPYKRFPLARIEQLRGGAVFDVVFNYTDFHVYAAAGAEPVRIDGADYFELTSFPMVVHVHRDRFKGSTQLAVCHDVSSVRSAAVESFLADFLAALESFAAPAAEARVSNGHERAIAEIVATAVGLDAVDVDANYLDAGIDSITSIRVLAKIRRRFPAATMRDVIESRTVRALARRLHAKGDPPAIDAAEHGPAGPARTRPLPDGVADAYPATALQLQMVKATQRDPAQSTYHDVFAYSIGLPLDEPLLRSALRAMTDSCEALRTAFVLDAAPVPLQHVYGSVEPDLTVVDAPGQPTAADEWFDRERGSGFAWDLPGLIRYAAHRTAEAAFVLSLSFHHSIIDGWSLSLLIRDLLTSYAAGLAGEEHHPPAQPLLAYRDYVRAEAAARSSAQSQAYWRDVLAGHPGTTLPRYRPDPAGRRWTETTVAVPAQQEARLRSVARHAGCPLKHLMLAAHLRTLALITGDRDVVTGVFTHGRLEAEGADRMIGMFLNFLPHRGRLHSQTWPEFIEEAFRFETRALPHRRYPAAAIGRDLGRAQLFPALFNYTEFPAYSEVAENGGYITNVRWFEHADVPFLVNVGRDIRDISQSRLEVTVNADGRLLPQAVTDGIASVYTAVLAQIAAQPGARVLDTTDEILATVEAVRPEGNEQP